MGKLKDTTIPDVDQGTCVCPGADYWFKQGLVVAMLRVQQCLSWDDEQVDEDGFPRQVIWQKHAVAAIRDAFNQSAPDE
jgi:hypothetical protein